MSRPHKTHVSYKLPNVQGQAGASFLARQSVHSEHIKEVPRRVFETFEVGGQRLARIRMVDFANLKERR